MYIRRERFEIRPVRADELAAILELYHQCEDFLALGPNPCASREMVETDLQHSSTQSGVYCGIFDHAGRLIGVVDVVPRNHASVPENAFLELLMITPTYRSGGLGAEVMRAVEEEIGRDGRVHVILSAVQVNNPGAIRFWERMGYRIVSGPESQPDQTVAYRLRKEL
jgi:RimJ/RimL family protein N-acetyltransferase